METDSYAVLTVPGYQVKVRLLLADMPTLTAWWDHRRPNRTILPRQRVQYRDAMVEGRWRLNGATVVVNQHGQLQDGQHRVRAALDALAINPGLVIPLLVAEAIDESAFSTHDCGKKRTFGHVLQARQAPNSNQRGAVIPWVWRARHGYLTAGGYPRNPTNDQSEALYATLEPILPDALHHGRAASSLLTLTLGAALWILLGEKSVTARDAFWSQLVTGAHLAEGDPVFALRRVLVVNAGARRKYHPSQVVALVIKAWNAYRAGRAIRTLSYRAEEAYPEIE